MNFEHLVEINDTNVAGLAPLSRAQLWRGLLMRAEQPELSVIGLDECRILERGEGFLHRELRFGAVRIRDRVLFLPMRSVVYETEASDTVPACRLTMAIEEPFPGRLFVRFTYADVVPRPLEEIDRFYDQYLKQAYLNADLDTVATIRELALNGELAGDL